MSALYPRVKDYFLLGSTLKSHGTSGQLRLMVENRLKGYLKKGVFVFLDINGSKVPYQIIQVQDAQHFVVRFKGVEGKNASDELAGKDMWIQSGMVRARHRLSPRSTREKWEDYTIHDTETSGDFLIRRTEEYPQQLMAVIEHHGREILIPLHEDLITDIDKANKIIHMSVPEGLLEL